MSSGVKTDQLLQSRWVSRVIEQAPSKLDQETIETLHSISRSRHPERFSREIFQFAMSSERSGQLSLAHSLYANLAKSFSVNPWTEKAQGRLKVLQGQGSAQEHGEFLLTHGLQRLLDTTSFGGLAAAGGTFSLLQGLGKRLWGTATLASRARTFLFATAGEVPAYSLSMRGIREARGEAQDWGWKAVSKSLAWDGLTIFTLKHLGVLGQGFTRGLRPGGFWTPGRIKFAYHATPQAAAFTGLMGVQAIEHAYHGTQPSSPWIPVMEVGATLVHFNVIGRFLPNWHRWDFSGKNLKLPLRGSKSPGEPPPGLVERIRSLWQSTLLQKYRPVVTTNGLVWNVNAAPSDFPRPPTYRPPPTNRPAPHSEPRESGVNLRFPAHNKVQRPILDPIANDAILASLNHTQFEIGNYLRNRSTEVSWFEKAPRWTKTLGEQVDHIYSAISEVKPDSFSLPMLRTISMELNRLHRLMGYVQGRGALYGVPLTSGDIFMDYLTQFSEGLTGFVKGRGPIGASLESINQARMALEEVNQKLSVDSVDATFGGMDLRYREALRRRMSETHSEYDSESIKEAPKFSSNLEMFMARESDRIASILQIIYMGNPLPGTWEPVAYRSAAEFRNLIELARSEFHTNPKRSDDLVDIEKIYGNAHLLTMRLNGWKNRDFYQRPSFSPGDFLVEFYKVPNQFKNYLQREEGKIYEEGPAELEGVNKSLRLAHEALLGPALPVFPTAAE